MSYILIDVFDPAAKRRLDAMRSRAKRAGFTVSKARGAHHLNNLGGLQIVDTCRNVVLYGDNYDLSLEQAESLIAELSQQVAA